jgi:metal-sulfur cluster biosynthetic enzyme
MAISEDAVREALKKVVDPELFVNVIDLGLVYLVELTEAGDKADVKVEMTMTSPACPAGPQLVSQAKTSIGALEGVGNVEVKVVMIPPWTPDRMTEEARDQLGIF